MQVEPAEAKAAIRAIVLKRRTATVSWKGNLAADRFDVAIKRRGPWRIVFPRTLRVSFRLRGSPGEHVRVRIRPYSVDGVAGPWAPARVIRFPKR